MLQAMVQPMVHPMVPPRLGHVDVAAEAVRRLGTGQEAKATTVVVRLHHTWKLKVGARGKLRICFLEARCEPWCWIWCWIFFFHTPRMAQFCRSIFQHHGEPHLGKPKPGIFRCGWRFHCGVGLEIMRRHVFTKDTCLCVRFELIFIIFYLCHPKRDGMVKTHVW